MDTQGLAASMMARGASEPAQKQAPSDPASMLQEILQTVKDIQAKFDALTQAEQSEQAPAGQTQE